MKFFKKISRPEPSTEFTNKVMACIAAEPIPNRFSLVSLFEDWLIPSVAFVTSLLLLFFVEQDFETNLNNDYALAAEFYNINSYLPNDDF